MSDTKTYEAVGSIGSVQPHDTLIKALVDLIVIRTIGNPLGVLIRDTPNCGPYCPVRFVTLKDIISEGVNI